MATKKSLFEYEKVVALLEEQCNSVEKAYDFLRVLPNKFKEEIAFFRMNYRKVPQVEMNKVIDYVKNLTDKVQKTESGHQKTLDTVAAKLDNFAKVIKIEIFRRLYGKV